MSGFGAGAGADMLQEILRQKFTEALQNAKLQEDIRQNNMVNDIALGRNNLEQQRITNEGNELNFRQGRAGIEDQRYNEAAPVRAANLRAVMANAANAEGLGARTAAAQQAAADLEANKEKFTAGENAKNRANAVNIANIRAAGQAKAAQGGVQDAYTAERNTRVLQSVDELDKKVSPWTTGAGALLSFLPATDARNFDAELQTLKANISFNELAEMRAASKTGGALGQVSNAEGVRLESALGALDSRQSPANFRAQLAKIKDSIQRWEAAKASAGVPQQKVGTGKPGVTVVGNKNDPLGLFDK